MKKSNLKASLIKQVDEEEERLRRNPTLLVETMQMEIDSKVDSKL